jgi:predicted CoA-substrate-specific enzyme activase
MNKHHQSLGLNIGSSSIKIVVVEDGKIVRATVAPHDGDFAGTFHRLVQTEPLPEKAKVLATGTEGRRLLNTANLPESLCVEAALNGLGLKADAVVTLGGEIFGVYAITDGKITNSFAGNKCASGTGEFFKQQLGRMDMVLDDVVNVPDDGRVCHMSSRCSVFMKSDCTHKLNKGEATKSDIALSLSDVMSTKVADFLKRARIQNGRVVLVGGVTKNRHILRFLKEKCPEITFIVPPEASYFEAYGAALLADKSGSRVPPMEKIFRPGVSAFATHPNLKSAEKLVTRLPSRRGPPKNGGEYILGVDGGSTTTKAALLDIATGEIVASHYGRTHGDPVKALKECLIELKKQMSGIDYTISMASTTGSSREILGVFLGTNAVYNEIIAHATGTTSFRPDIDTIFEIGGQDAKYALLKNGVPIDYAMNEACSAGTGSFLEESCAGDLNITDVREIGPIAVKATAPLKFGEQCSAFINSDIRKAIQFGASREDIAAGIITSIVSNYLNRVVGNRTIGDHIVLQGGVALNEAVPLAFAMLMNKPIIIPPNPELLGCFGVALLAKNKLKDGFLTKSSFVIDEILKSEIIYEKEFVCHSCDNKCPIRMLNVNGKKSPFGGRCNKYANLRKKGTDENALNWVERREKLLFEESVPAAASFVQKRPFTVGVPKAFSVYSLWPLYSWFFHELGIKTVLSDEICREGAARTEGSYCFPAEIAHGAVQDILNKKTDYIFTPHFRDMESLEKDVHANFCPITQSLPYYIKQAFPEAETSRFLSPVVSFKFGPEKALEGFFRMTDPLNIPQDEVRAAFTLACAKQDEFWAKYKAIGREALDLARKAGHPVVAILGRPYNAFTADANMGIPRKFTSRGHTVIPFDMLPFSNEEITKNMYWYYGQQDMKATVFLKDEPNIFITFITNFSCAPDSFILHYVKWFMGTKPFLILELDSHSADAGVDTRVEAFLDIIEGYRSRIGKLQSEDYDNGLRFVNDGKSPIHVMDTHNQRRIEVFNNPKLKLLLSNMGQLATEIMGVVLRSANINAEALPLPDTTTLQIARGEMSGKECLPSQLVLGSVLEYLQSEHYRKDETYLVFVPITTGPCRTGQYFVYYEQVFKRLRLENVVVMTLSADNSYNELGTGINRLIWKGVVIGDYMKDIQTSLRTCAKDPATALARYEQIWKKLIADAGRGIKNLDKGLVEVAREINKLPLKSKLKETPKILVVGEIYVRRDDFAVDELIGMFSNRGIIAKVAGISEWIYYVDHVRLHDITKRLKLVPFWKRLFSKPFRQLLVWHITEAYKHAVDAKTHSVLGRTHLIPHTPHDMEEIMQNAQTHFVSDELYSEISVSSGVASTAMLKDFSGIVNISPFGCLIGRVIEGLITPWSRERKFPVISVEIDGAILPPNIVNKLEIFILNALRFRHGGDASALVEKAPEEESA